MRKQLQPVLKAAKAVADKIDLSTVQDDIEDMAAKPIELPPIIDGEHALKQSAKILMRMQQRRSRLAGMLVSVFGKREALKALREEARGCLIQEPKIANMRNEAVRSAAMLQVIKPLEKIVGRLWSLQEQIDVLSRALQHNQEALIVQIQIWKNEFWSEQRRDG